MDVSDHQRFIKLLFYCNTTEPVNFREIPKGVTFADYLRGDTLVDIGAYCLMPNHFHLLVHEKNDNGITIFMRKLATAYSMYFNVKNERKGKLFEGPFLSSHADSDDYLKYLFAYIHLNPIKLIEPKWKETGLMDGSNASDFLDSYEYSSYSDYLGKHRDYGEIIAKEAFPDYFKEDTEFEQYIADWLNYKDLQR